MDQYSGIHEKRYRVIAGLDWRVKHRYKLQISTGYERVQNSNFEIGQSANNAFIGVGLSLYFDEFDIGP